VNPLSENEFFGIDEEGMYFGKEALAALDVVYSNDDNNMMDMDKDKDNVLEEDSDSGSGSGSGSEYEFESEFEEELKDSQHDHIQYVNSNKEDPPMTVGTVYRTIDEFKLALPQHAI